MLFDKKTKGEKIIQGIIMIMSFCAFVAVPCGIVYLINLIPNVAISYWIPAAIGAFMYLFLLLIAVNQLIQFKKFDKKVEKEFGNWKI
jgi:hypothetical protein